MNYVINFMFYILRIKILLILIIKWLNTKILKLCINKKYIIYYNYVFIFINNLGIYIKNKMRDIYIFYNILI